jgi:hypothetical protein
MSSQTMKGARHTAVHAPEVQRSQIFFANVKDKVTWEMSQEHGAKSPCPSILDNRYLVLAATSPNTCHF